MSSNNYVTRMSDALWEHSTPLSLASAKPVFKPHTILLVILLKGFWYRLERATVIFDANGPNGPTFCSFILGDCSLSISSVLLLLLLSVVARRASLPVLFPHCVLKKTSHGAQAVLTVRPQSLWIIREITVARSYISDLFQAGSDVAKPVFYLD